MKRVLLLSTIVAVPFLSPTLASAADQEPVQQRVQKQTREQIYGSQLMTRQERVEYRARMRAAKNAEEREQIRNEHHEKMKVRASEKGVTLPDMPPARGGGMGQGGGRGR